MRTMFKTTLALSFVCAMGLGITTTAGASVCVSVGVNPAYEPCDDGDVDCDNMIVVDDNQVGYWMQLPSGRWIFRCRSMWFDIGLNIWRFGPWWNNYSIVYGSHFNGIRYHTYFEQRYPHRPYPFFRRDFRDYDRHELGRRDYRDYGNHGLGRRDDHNYGSNELRRDDNRSNPQVLRKSEPQQRSDAPRMQHNSEPQRSQTTIRSVERPGIKTTTVQRTVVRDARRR
jgi:hypothetical protein